MFKRHRVWYQVPELIPLVRCGRHRITSTDDSLPIRNDQQSELVFVDQRTDIYENTGFCFTFIPWHIRSASHSTGGRTNIRSHAPSVRFSHLRKWYGTGSPGLTAHGLPTTVLYSITPTKTGLRIWIVTVARHGPNRSQQSQPWAYHATCKWKSVIQ